MDQAIYDTTSASILGVRGQWIMKFNASTGAFINALRFTSDNIGISTIVQVGAFVYIGTSLTPSNDLSLGTPFLDRDVYIVEPIGLTTSGRFNLGNQINFTFGQSTPDYYGLGWRSFVKDTANSIIGLVDTGSLFAVDPTFLGSFATVSFGLATDIAYDSLDDVIWITDQATPNIWCYSANPLGNNTCFDTNSNLLKISGICWNQAQNKVYCVDGTFTLYHFAATLAVPAFTNFLVSSSVIPVPTARPFRVKSVNGLPSNPLNGKVLIPCWSDANGPSQSDSVVVWDPLTEAVSGAVRTGFVSPIDIVSTPTKNWAVQSGPTGLQEII